MNNERTCPVHLETKLYKASPCGGKILRKEPVLSPKRLIGHIYGPKNIEGGRAGEKRVLYYLYECENGHIINRPDWWANVPMVPPGTIKSIHGTVVTPYDWYQKPLG